MGKLSFWESVRVWFGGVAFDVFLWSVRMTADDYFDMIQTDGGLTQRAPDSPYVCLHCGAHILSDHLPWCKSLSQNGGR